MHPLDVDNGIKRALRELLISDSSILPSILNYISCNYHFIVFKSRFSDSIYLVSNNEEIEND